MDKVTHVFKEKSLVIILAYAPAGLGHLRVTRALYQGLPIGVAPILLGSQDRSVTWIHRFTSIHPFARAISLWMQQGLAQDLFTYLYRRFLRENTLLLYQQLVTVLDQQIHVPKTVLVVATHFGLAHKLAVIKEKISRDKGVKVILVVQVTDDSPQHIWYVPGADMIFTPSERTCEGLMRYAKNANVPLVSFNVAPYPLSPILSDALSPSNFAIRLEQVKPVSSTTIHVSIPISGAAVGLTFFTSLIGELNRHSQNFRFHIVSKMTPYTEKFLNQLLGQKHVDLTLSSHDREVVEKYETLYRSEIISLEVTKPSEQSFKALLEPRDRGGVVLLFNQPVGRQEYDNLDFLRRHNLIPLHSEKYYLFEKARRRENLPDFEEGRRIINEAVNWRGIELPEDPLSAAQFIWWVLKQGIFTHMMKCRVSPKATDRHANELSAAGVKIFWEKVAQFLISEKTA